MPPTITEYERGLTDDSTCPCGTPLGDDPSDRHVVTMAGRVVTLCADCCSCADDPETQESVPTQAARFLGRLFNRPTPRA